MGQLRCYCHKFYVAAINSALYVDNDYYLPVGYSKEINYYVSYFDPLENVGQVYWYKDGDNYIIYAHCQEEHSNLAINFPDYMEGATLSVVEKTDNTELLSETIQNGKIFVNYNTTDANYIVLIASNPHETEPEPSILKGDANGDKGINAADIVEVVNCIMGNPSAKYNNEAADANNNKTVNAADIVKIVNIIMGIE